MARYDDLSRTLYGISYPSNLFAHRFGTRFVRCYAALFDHMSGIESIPLI